MTKTKRLILLALVSLFIAPSKGLALTFEFEDFPESRRMEATLKARWREWSAKYGAPANGNGIIRVRRLAKGENPSLAGTIGTGEIQIRNPEALAHELAHLYVHGVCPSWRHDLFLHEALALWLSGDYNRIERNWPLYDDAAAYLRGKTEPGQKFESALARVISQHQEQFGTFALEALKQCEPKAQAFAMQALGIQGRQEIPGEVRFVLLDGKSGRILAAEGDTKRRAPVGSTLKPWLLDAFPALRGSLLEEPGWKCDSPARSWSWPEALIKSCNGFFLGHKFLAAGAWQKFTREAKALGLPSPPKEQASLVGIRPNYRLSVEEMARLYRFLSLKKSDVIPKLSEVAASGTLAEAEDSAWLKKAGLLVKTGSVRGGDSLPLASWIAVVAPGDDMPDLVAVIQASGIATIDLSRKIRHLIGPYLNGGSNESLVQVLGIQQNEIQSIGCTEGQAILEGSNPLFTRLTLKNMRAATKYTCAAGPIEITYGRGGAGKRLLYGSLELNGEPQEAGKLSKRERARSGSPLILRTSEFEYVFGTVASEYPNGNTETLKVLALAVRENGRRGRRHGIRPVCDTTHCQVYGQAKLSAVNGTGGRISSAVHAILPLKVTSSAEWFPFSLGGAKPWKKIVPEKNIRLALGLAGASLAQISLRKDTLQVTNSSGAISEFPCEVARNALQLLSCPGTANKSTGGWEFSGKGEGHGLGLDLETADALAGSGYSFQTLWRRFYGLDL